MHIQGNQVLKRRKRRQKEASMAEKNKKQKAVENHDHPEMT